MGRIVIYQLRPWMFAVAVVVVVAVAVVVKVLPFLIFVAKTTA